MARHTHSLARVSACALVVLADSSEAGDMSASGLSGLVAKLSHPLAEVRQRSVHSLRSKVDGRLVPVSNLSSEAALPGSLMTLAASTESLPSVQLDALVLLERLAGDSAVARQLVKLGAIGELQRVQATAMAGSNGDADAVTAAAARAAEAILHHPVGELPFIEIPSAHEHTPPPTTTAPPARLPTAGGAGGAGVMASRSLQADFAGAVSYTARGRDGADLPGGRRLADAKLALPCPPWMDLRAAAALGRSDEQALFEGSVRLQMTDGRVLHDTCAAIGGTLCRDLPASALLSRPELYTGLVSLLRTTEAAGLGQLALAALEVSSRSEPASPGPYATLMRISPGP